MTFWVGLSWVLVSVSFSVLIGVVAWMALRARNAHRDITGDAPGFKIENYRPMESLLAEQDFAFLKTQPGYNREIGERWKRERRRLFRLYFKDLKRDFRRLHAEARRVVAHAGADSADLVRVLMYQRWNFAWAIANLECRLALARVGIGHVDIAPLIELMETMRVNVSRLAAPQAV